MMHNQSHLMAGIDFPWKHISGYFMCVRSFKALAQLSGDEVGSTVAGIYGMVNAELPNPDAKPEDRIIALPIEHKADYKSLSRAHLDTGVKDSTNELVLIYEHRRNLLGRPKSCIHLAIYPAGTWRTFFDAVNSYKAQDFKWPRPLILFQPSATNIFPATTNIFSN